VSTGGSAAVGTTGGLAAGGGLSATGGATTTTPTGGTSTTGNGGSTTAAGGSTQSNGGSASATGGANGNGGAKSTGGTSGGTGGSTSSCSDVAPNNGDTCAHAVEYGWCTQSWLGASCQRSCGKCTGAGTGGSTSTGGSTGNGGTKSTGGTSSGTGGSTTSTGGTPSTGGSTGGASVPLLTNGTQGRTTRYWDCCKPSCGWAANAQAGGKSSPATSCGKDGSSTVAATTQSVCSGGSAYQCNWGAPWQAGPNLSYGYAAFNGSNCGKCYQLDFTGSGDNTGAQSLKGKTMIVQAVNIGDIGANHFDLLIPGGGVGANNGCTGSNGQWGNVNGGAQSGGFLATCGNNMSCITDMCKTAFGSNSSLIAGCSSFVGWFAAANNPGVLYAEVPCPAEISNRSGLR
jgi:hypothetical protein